jgi:hypothetical protein
MVTRNKIVRRRENAARVMKVKAKAERVAEALKEKEENAAAKTKPKGE